MDDGKISEETRVSPGEMAAVLRVTGRRVRQLTEDGVLHKIDGTYPLIENLHRWHEAGLRSAATDEEELKLDKARKKAEAQLKASKALMAKLEAEELQGSMHRAEDVEAMTTDLIFTMRGALMALPGRLAVDTAACDDPAETSVIITREVRAVMRELAAYRYDPAAYEARVRARQNWDASREDEEE